MIPPALNLASIANLKYRQNIRNAFTLIDARPPKISVHRTMQLSRHKEDANTEYSRNKQNMKLLERMNRLERTNGEVDTFHKHPLAAHTANLNNVKKYMRRIERENEQLGRRLMRAVPLCETHMDPAPHNIIRRRRLPQLPEEKRKSSARREFVMPVEILQKYENMNVKLPRSVDLQRRLLRPCIYMDLAVRNCYPLGRIVIELFTEASPQVVLEFVRVCSETPPTRRKVSRRQNQSERFDKRHPLLGFIRNFPTLWIEGELKLNLNSMCDRRIEYDMRALDHNSGAGILSYSSRFLRGFKNGFINFTISFRPLAVANGRRVAFGRVVSGLKTLDCLQEYGTKNGTPRGEIIVASCGVLSK